MGQPALGPPSFRHRFSAVYDPVAPITQQWLDSTRITYGVLTIGFVRTDRVKIEGSFFRGREPDENRWGIESPAFDSYSLGRGGAIVHDDYGSPDVLRCEEVPKPTVE